MSYPERTCASPRSLQRLPRARMEQRSMAHRLPLRKAQYDGHCHKCQRTFPAGTWIRWSNRPYRGYIACWSCVGADEHTGQYHPDAPDTPTDERDDDVAPVPVAADPNNPLGAAIYAAIK